MLLGLALVAVALLIGGLNQQALGAHLRRVLRRDPSPVTGAGDPLIPLRRLAMELRPAPVHDAVLVLDFAAIWLAILGLALVAKALDQAWAYVLIGVTVAGRFRALEELAHFSMHNALSRNGAWARGLADLLSQFPLFNPSTRLWAAMHCAEHHPNAGSQQDPAFQSLLDAGLTKGMGPAGFARLVFHPFTPAGLWARLRFAAMGLDPRLNGKGEVALRLLAIASIWIPIAMVTSPTVVAWVFLPALIVWLPWFSWLSLLCEHSWFDHRLQTAATAVEREVFLGKRTAFPGASGWVLRALIFPVGDTRHLAHSLFPTLHFRHLAWFERQLETHCELYRQAAPTRGLWGFREAPTGSLKLLYNQTRASDGAPA